MSLYTVVPPNSVLTSGVGSALTWTNAVSVSSMNVSSLGASNLSVSTLTTSTSVSASSLVTSSITANSVGYSTLSGSTINATRLNYSSIVGSSISSNAMTLSLTNASTQNTQIYQVATTNPMTSYTAIQASHVSTGTTNNALVLNPSGGNVGVGTTTPAVPFVVSGSSTGYTTGMMNVINNNTAPQACANILAPNISSTNGMLINIGKSLTGYNAMGLAYYHQGDGLGTNYLNIAPYGNANGLNVLANGNVGIGTTNPGATLDVVGTVRGSIFTSQYTSVYAGNSTNTFTLTVPYPATYLFTVTGNGAYVGGGGDNYAKAIIYIHIGSSGVLLTTVVQAQGVAINSYTPGTQALSYNIGTGGLPLQFGGNSSVSIIRLG